ncbi:MAG: flagellar hook-associated protein FlgL [Nitrospiraceae bacterium]|nr:flagellar hook-associated protein FlgL [Nitrospiraceae bacterium]MDA8090880.1 flagellar hook-associated protein FlgL [Nitrospiraceae bacterium]
MRVGSFSIYNQISGSLDQEMSTITQLENQLSSGKKFSKNSDNVTGVISAMDYNLDLNQDNRYLSNIDSANALLGDESTAMSSTMDALNNAKEIALEGANGTNTGQDMTALAQQVYQIRDELLGYANTKTADGSSVFAGYQTQTDAFNNSTYAYQGDSGIVNAQVSNSQLLPVNVPGSNAFSYTLSSPVTVTQSDGSSFTYTQGSGGTINVQIKDSGNNVVDSFSFSNFMQLTNLLGDALNSGDTRRVSALMTPLDDAINQATNVSSDIGARQSRLTNQQNSIQQDQANTQVLLSGVQDDDIAQTTTQLAKYQASIQALEESTAKISSQTLLDFLK